MTATLAIAVLAASRAEAHSVGLSQSDFTLGEGGDGRVEARLVFAQGDAATLARGARGEGGPDLRDAVENGVEVLGDGHACKPEYRGERSVGGDGVEVRAEFDCARRPHELVVSLPLLDELPPSHVHLIRLSSGGREKQAALQSGGAHATLTLSALPLLSRGTSLVLLALFLAALLAGGVQSARHLARRRRTTRP